MNERLSKRVPAVERGARVLALLALLVRAAAVPALSTDKDQAIEVEADAAELDDVKRVSTYRGNVVVTQGSIRITGDVMTVHYTKDDKLELLVIEGDKATYRQLPDNSKEYDKAEAKRMEYHEPDNLVILTGEAMVNQKRVQFSGNRIEYDTANSQVRAWSKPGAETAVEEGEKGSTGERVKLIIKKKEKPGEGQAPEKP